MTETDIKSFETIQYIRTTRELTYRVLSGRHTVLDKGVPGIILREDNIDELFYLNEWQRKECFESLEYVQKNNNKTLALVQGFLCILDEDDFYKCDKPKCYPVAFHFV